MKSLKNYIFEAIKALPNNKKGIIVFDIDDTLLRVDKNRFKVYKTMPDGSVARLTTDEYAKDPDAGDPSKKHLFDLKDFKDPIKVYTSIVKGKPIIKNLKILDAYINAGYDFSFLTARDAEFMVKKAIEEFIEVRRDGKLTKLGNEFKKCLSAAVNDSYSYSKYPGETDSEKKANVLKQICRFYSKVVYVDDDEKNLKAARDLNIDKLTVIKAWE